MQPLKCLLLAMCACLFLISEVSELNAQPVSNANEQAPIEIYQGFKLASNLTRITGLAISPLFGLSALGTFEYFTNPDSRESLPWFCAPFVWGIGLSLVFIFFINDYIPVLNKFSSGIENLVDTVCPILVAPMFLPGALSALGEIQNAANPAGGVTGEVVHASIIPYLGQLDIVSSSLVPVFMIVVGFISFVAVWMAGQVINLLMMISPLPFVNSVLRSVKLSLVGIIAFANAIHPVLGMVLSVTIILIALILFKWTFRYSIFGLVNSIALLLLPWHKKQSIPASVLCFADSGLAGIPNKTLGWMSRTKAEQLIFSYRPWLVFPKKSISLEGRQYYIGKEFIMPSLWAKEDQNSNSILLFSCQYLSREDDLGKTFGFQNSRLVGWRKKSDGMWASIRSLFGKRENTCS